MRQRKDRQVRGRERDRDGETERKRQIERDRDRQKDRQGEEKKEFPDARGVLQMWKRLTVAV